MIILFKSSSVSINRREHAENDEENVFEFELYLRDIRKKGKILFFDNFFHGPKSLKNDGKQHYAFLRIFHRNFSQIQNFFHHSSHSAIVYRLTLKMI